MTDSPLRSVEVSTPRFDQFGEGIPAGWRAFGDPRTYITLRFRRDVTFPRYGHGAGSTVRCNAALSTGRRYLHAIDRGQPAFDYAGGQCLVSDVELIHTETFQPLAPEVPL